MEVEDLLEIPENVIFISAQLRWNQSVKRDDIVVDASLKRLAVALFVLK